MTQKYNMIKEIGSEFWLKPKYDDNYNDNIFKSYEFEQNKTFLLSGRTAIDYVLQDIMLKKDIKKVYFPSYCCQSMLQAFQDKNIEIVFYKVTYNGKLEYDIDLNTKCDIFYAMNYFGFEKSRMDYYIEKFATKQTIIIEDITHSLLSEKMYNTKSDYMIASLRKWFPIISGGLAIKKCGSFEIDAGTFETNKNFYNTKKKAMEKKSKYILGETNISKEEFLKEYQESNEELNKNYKNYTIDEESLEILRNIDIAEIRENRRQNAKMLISKLNKNVKILFDLKNGDCPLFVPIIVKKEYRNDLRKYLVDNQIFCPVHWPKPSIIAENDLYEIELSLICDQRYSEKEMEKEVNVINNFFEEKEL